MAASKDKKKPKPKPKPVPYPVFEGPEALAAINKLPADDPAVAEAVCAELVAGGEERIVQLIGFLGEFGEDNGVRPRFALHALASYCSRAKADDERKLLARTMARQLDADRSPSVKAFLIRQLQLAGTPAEVPAPARRLPDARLGLPAVAALTAIGDEAAIAALRDALPAAKGSHRVGIIEALGRLRDQAAAKPILKAAGDEDRDTRLAALYALANIGDPAAIGTVEAAVKAETPYQRTQAVEACLLLARRLAERDRTREAKALYQHLLATCTADHEKHVRHAAQQGLDALAK